MSFSEKLAGLMARPNQDAVPKDDVQWWMKYAGRGLGTIGSFIAIFLGVWNCVGIMFGQVGCLLSGMMQMCAGFIVIVCEAPCCCMFVDFVQNLSDWVERRPYWHKAAMYIVMAIPPIILCPGLSSIFGSGLIFATGVIYGMMSLGKKATAEEMRTAANNLSQPSPAANPYVGKDISSNMKSNLVDNAQPPAFTGMPIDSNV